MTIIIHDFEKENWQDTRVKYSLGPFLGGSEAPIVGGHASHTSPTTLMERKKGREEFPDLSDNIAVQRGISMEPIILDEVAKILDVGIYKPNCMLLHEEYPWMIANYDGVTEDGWIVEIKTTSSMTKIDYAKQDMLTPDYLAQGDHYLWFNQFDGCPNPGEEFHGVIFAICHHVHSPPILIRVPRVDRWTGGEMATLLAAEEEFIRMFNDNEMPDLDGHDSTFQTLKNKYTMGDDVRDPTEQQSQWHQVYKEANKIALEQKKIATEARNRLRDSMGSSVRKVYGICSLYTQDSFSKKLLTEKLKSHKLDYLVDESCTEIVKFRVN